MDKGWVRRHYLAVREIQRNVERKKEKYRGNLRNIENYREI